MDCKIMGKMFPVKGIEKKCKDAQKCIVTGCKKEMEKSKKMKEITSKILKKNCKKETKEKNIEKMVQCIRKKMKASDYKKISDAGIELSTCQMKKCQKELESLGKDIAKVLNKKRK